ncbi:DUF2391 family protein [Halobaculum sp. CBA1158]|uniref:DUF2391 family protein n=1 Tax=Halobaculum sp. CBA1158 TaxID=2904243 RepID=UPI001F388A31|nr:DUF2391 family protein [Halobaculum sp. CBA1158]UIP00551.1 DUF2391 family protein [Halobaculum sp. CBA1158]
MSDSHGGGAGRRDGASGGGIGSGDDGDADGVSTVEDLIEDLETLEESVDDADERRKVRDAMRTARDLSTPHSGVFGRVVRGFDRGDLAEALVGSVLFGIPMLVEGGTTEVGAFIATRPASLAGTAAFAVALTVGILYVAEFQDVRVQNPILGVVPRRPVGVLGVAVLTAVVGLTAWGRVDWAEPTVALGSVLVATVPMAVGAALGDLLPG